MKTHIEIAPQLTLVKFYIRTLWNLPNVGVQHPTLPYALIIPRETSYDGALEHALATGPLSSWLAARLLQSPNEILGDWDLDKLTNFEEYAMGSDPVQPDIQYPAVSYPNLTHVALEFSRNLEPTGIEHRIEIGDGISSWRPAVEGSDYVKGDMSGAGVLDFVEDAGLDRRVRSVLRNLHGAKTEPALAFLRIKFIADLDV
jgi:hypothetical protein